ncbi:ClbS/DfsB family four-helix bundle protein [Sulfitobacter sp. F26169L]|uniref:ClbS/DfsB family four-helix bundle protein n=1 Tax=Sulfitobacter sp. F26169L TaxID=2996015 RepID=UPI002260BE1F|nr:ClbS/DfsB family four-helix bundle protein [Sulfitobacter sp. F26169L]MCX7566405.1 ClbS/DfsB family four-helix bundle protein [Sulfitobacter sp. F26169L]
MPDSRSRETTLQGHARGTSMSAADLAGWNELVLKWLELDDQGCAVDFPETGFKWNELRRLARKFYADYETLGYAGLGRRLKTANADIARTVSQRSGEELYGAPWYGKWTKGRMIQFNTSSPYTNARGRIRKWLKAQDVKR